LRKPHFKKNTPNINNFVNCSMFILTVELDGFQYQENKFQILDKSKFNKYLAVTRF